MNQFELNQIRSKLRRLDLDDQFIERYLEKLIRNKESFVTASKAIDRWDKKDSGQFVLQALAYGLIAALAGGWFAVVQWRGEWSHERCKLDSPVQRGDGLNADCVVPGLSAYIPPGARTHIDAENAAPP